MFFGKRVAVVTVAFGIFVSGAMSMPGDGILKAINAELGKISISNSAINSDHIKDNHFLGKFEDRSLFVSKQFEIIRRIVTAENSTVLGNDVEVSSFIENIGLGIPTYLYEKRPEFFSDVHRIFVHLFMDVMQCPITAETPPRQIQQFLLAFLRDDHNRDHQSFLLALRIFSYASSIKTLFKLDKAKSLPGTTSFLLDDSGKCYGVREIGGNGIELQVVQQTTNCENPKKYSFLEITGNEDVAMGVSNKFWLLDLSSKGNLPNILRRFIANYGLSDTMIKYSSRGSTMIEFMTSDPIPVVQHYYILGEGWQSCSSLNIDYCPQSRFCALAISGKPKKIASVYMISPYVFQNKRNPFEGLQRCFQGDMEIKSIPQVFSKMRLETERELLPSNFDTMNQQGIHVFDDYLENQANVAEIEAFFAEVEEVFPPQSQLVTRENFRRLLRDEQNQTLAEAINQLFDYIDNPDTIQLFFGSEGRGYTVRNMQNHLRRIVNILSAIVDADDAARQNVIRSLVENIQFNGGCAQGYRNRLYAILVALL